MKTHLEIAASKIFRIEEFSSMLAFLKFKNYKIIFTNGCFDILHRGHIEYLSKAADQGQFLIIGLNTDSSVKKIKGKDRPVQDEYSRALQLASLSFVDAVIYFDEDTPYNLIKEIQPDILVKGGDYKPEEIVGYDIVTAKGGLVKSLQFIEGFSTTSILQKINAL